MKKIVIIGFAMMTILTSTTSLRSDVVCNGRDPGIQVHFIDMFPAVFCYHECVPLGPCDSRAGSSSGCGICFQSSVGPFFIPYYSSMMDLPGNPMPYGCEERGDHCSSNPYL